MGVYYRVSCTSIMEQTQYVSSASPSKTGAPKRKGVCPFRQARDFMDKGAEHAVRTQKSKVSTSRKYTCSASRCAAALQNASLPVLKCLCQVRQQIECDTAALAGTYAEGPHKHTTAERCRLAVDKGHRQLRRVLLSVASRRLLPYSCISRHICRGAALAHHCRALPPCWTPAAEEGAAFSGKAQASSAA